MECEESETVDLLLQRREEMTQAISTRPYSINLYFDRSKVYGSLGYPDLAAMDLYKCMLLVDEVKEDSSEFHDESLQALREHIYSLSHSVRLNKAEKSPSVLAELKDELIADSAPPVSEDECILWAEKIWLPLACVHFAYCLTIIGCLRDAYVHLKRISIPDNTDANVRSEVQRVSSLIREIFSDKGHSWIDEYPEPSRLPNEGHVRREIYPWNLHEQERNSDAALQLLNEDMDKVAPALEVRLTELPALSSEDSKTVVNGSVQQLGVFALRDLQPNEEVLRERSMLTANARLHEPLCDACSAPLPELDQLGPQDMGEQFKDGGTMDEPISCVDCEDIVFCSQECHDLAQSSYHPAICGMDVESISKDVPPEEAADALYSLLLLRALSLSVTQARHPLDLKEVKYIWGDFTKRRKTTRKDSSLSFAKQKGIEEARARFHAAPRTLPFTLSANITMPLHILEKMDLDIYSVENNLAEAWVYNTLYAKFRGTASARISPRDGRPEVAAVHPLWCLANHSCDPNVEWEWAGQIKFRVRDTRTRWNRMSEDGSIGKTKDPAEGGIRKDDEVLNHYVDIELPVKERREWGQGALGGLCMCIRCQWEDCSPETN